MDCREIIEHEWHERYLLGRLDEAERRDYEQHLSVCPSCRKEMVHEQQMIAGIRETGKEAMKNEIRKQAATFSARESRVNWARIAKIAAIVFVILITPSVYFILNRESATFDSAPKVGQVTTDSQASYDEESGETPEHSVEVAPSVDSKKETPQSTLDLQSKTPTTLTPSPKAAPEGTLRDEDEVVVLSEKPSPAFRQRLEKQARVSELRLATPAARSFSGRSERTREFIRNGKTFLVTAFTLPTDDEKNEARSSSELPASFAVKVTRNDSTHLSMNWYVSRQFIQSYFDEMSLNPVSAESLQVILKDGSQYAIPVSQDSVQTHARLIREE